jgi:small-conductance mechanosensitive channel
MAIGVIVRYTVIFLGFIMAIASSGFDLNKISILAGGLGVGIGFGLQNLVANFIAGLILIFERPIVVGDTIESEQIEGEVKQIGIRSSKILTYDGAEVIIPNSNLINNKLSNWTLSNYSRRQLIIVRTSLKADPEKVLEILNRITRQHENVLATPEPFVLFDGQLEQSLQFKIYYWLISGIFKTRGELNLQIYRELKEIGVELPIPVHEIRRSVEEESDINKSLL